MTEPKAIANSFARVKGTVALEKFDPIGAHHPIIGTACFGCDRLFEAGDVTTLIPIGPGDDQEAREKAASGGWYNAQALVVHWSCATGEDA